MTDAITYPVPAPAAAIITNTNITTSEATLVTVSDYKYFQKSQVTLYYQVTLNSATQVKFRYYFTPDNVTWYRVPAKNISSGLLADIPTVIDSTSPTESGKIQTMEDFGISGALGFKVTGQAVTDTAQLNNLSVFVRDN